jgi:hypothetical protein
MKMTDFYDIDPKKEDAYLIATLARIPRKRVPSNFVQATTLRFQSAVRARYWRQFAVSSAVLVAVASIMLWVILVNFPSVAVGLATAAGKFKALLDALSIVWNCLPQFGATVTLSLWLVVLGSAGMLVKLAKNTAAAKLSVSVSRTTH